ncbi:t-SNARE [Penicillium citrinum]|uniref:t-SNARE n=1 Tax=Penicillium citrinum TaxID=5077 RepID=A0A9W9PCJ3_PENCI|nr:t-SNARE [Penicillium citrinum]KAJ5242027.1 t-SNARE [Penicillium citrinum]
MNGFTEDLEAGATDTGYNPPSLQQNGFQHILQTRRLINEELQKIEQTHHTLLRPAQQALLDASNSTEDYQANSRLTAIDEEISESFRRIRGLIADLKAASDRADPRIEEQIKIIGNSMEQPLQDYRMEQTQFSKKLREQVRRRYEISHPDATESEVSQGVENVIEGGEQLFAVQGVRSQMANDARSAVQQRSEAIRKIEQDLIAVAALFEEVAELVEEHEFKVEKIEENAISTHDNIRGGNEKLSFAVQSARNARKWKWWILLVCILIIAIIVGASVGWCKATDHC